MKNTLLVLACALTFVVAAPAKAAQYEPNVNSCIAEGTMGTPSDIYLHTFKNTCSSPIIFYAFQEGGKYGDSRSDTILPGLRFAGLDANVPVKYFACPYSPLKSTPVKTGTSDMVDINTTDFQCMVLPDQQ